MKRGFFIFTTIFLFLLLGGCVGFGYWYNETRIKPAFAEQESRF